MRPAEEIRVGFTALAPRLDPELGPFEPGGSPPADALEAIGLAAAAATRRLGPASSMAPPPSTKPRYR